jgi:hypothetical protein
MVDHEAYSLLGVTPCSLIYCIGTDIFEICIFAVLVSLTDMCLKLSSRNRHVHAGCKRHCSVNAQ